MEVEVREQDREEEEERRERGEKRVKLASGVDSPPGLAQPGAAQKPLSLNDLLEHMQAGFTKMSREAHDNKQDLTRELNKVKQEQVATKEMAAKALTNTDAMKDEMTKLEARISALENGSPPKRSSHSGFDQLGGQNGNEAVIGQFPEHTSRDERIKAWEVLRNALPNELRDQVKDVMAPGLRGKIVIATLQNSGTTVREARQNLLAFCRQVRQLKPEYEWQGQTHQIYAIPTKPYEMRQKEARAGLKIDTIKHILGPETAAKVEYDVAKGRVYLDKTLLASRQNSQAEIKYHIAALQEYDASLSATKLQEIEAKMYKIREEKQAPK